jgi:hypothetical protein
MLKSHCIGTYYFKWRFFFVPDHCALIKSWGGSKSLVDTAADA